MTESPEQAEDLRRIARRARVLASAVSEPDRTRMLNYAEELEAQAAERDRA